MRRACRHFDAVQLAETILITQACRITRGTASTGRSHAGHPVGSEATEPCRDCYDMQGERRGMVSGLVRLPAWRSSDRSDRIGFQCERPESRARRRLRQLRTVLPISLAASLFRVPASHRYRPRLPRRARTRNRNETSTPPSSFGLSALSHSARTVSPAESAFISVNSAVTSLLLLRSLSSLAGENFSRDSRWFAWFPVVSSMSIWSLYLQTHLFQRPLCREPFVEHFVEPCRLSAHFRQSRPTKCMTKVPARLSWTSSI